MFSNNIKNSNWAVLIRDSYPVPVRSYQEFLCQNGQTASGVDIPNGGSLSQTQIDGITQEMTGKLYTLTEDVDVSGDTFNVKNGSCIAKTDPYELIADYNTGTQDVEGYLYYGGDNNQQYFQKFEEMEFDEIGVCSEAKILGAIDKTYKDTKGATHVLSEKAEVLIKELNIFNEGAYAEYRAKGHIDIILVDDENQNIISLANIKPSVLPEITGDDLSSINIGKEKSGNLDDFLFISYGV